jgi:DNA-binding transcriptional ArsR family regulator
VAVREDPVTLPLALAASRSFLRREATGDEARALANPLRLRILRLCLDEALTNKQVADALGRDPGSTLHHVRMLVDTGFLEPTEVRQGTKGALEKPYRATGKSWQLSVSDPDHRAGANLAVVDAFRDELAELTDPDEIVALSRFANVLDEDSLADFTSRLQALVEEFALRHDPGGTPYAFLVGGHRRTFVHPPDPPAASGAPASSRQPSGKASARRAAPQSEADVNERDGPAARDR